MGMKDRMMNKAAEKMSEQSAQLFKEIIRVQESMHGYLEKLLEVQRLHHNYVREKNGDEPVEFKDEWQ